MNKELIKENLDAFMHWLNGGAILSVYVGKHHDSNGWCNITDIWEKEEAYLVVINDEYIELRKAIAEGKTVQIKICGLITLWVELTEEMLPFNKSCEYRIKPQEPDFEVGDWVTNKGKDPQRIIRINNEFLYFDRGSWCHPDPSGNFNNVLEHWKPNKNEWCWFSDYKTDAPHLRQFNGLIDGKYSAVTGGGIWNCCEPFIGTLPTYFIEKEQ